MTIWDLVTEDAKTEAVETLAQSLHAAMKLTVPLTIDGTPGYFLDWSDSIDSVREARRTQARYLLTHYVITPRA